MKKIFTDNLPKHKTRISWKDCIDKKIYFQYNNINGFFYVTNYIKEDKIKYLEIKYLNKNKYKISISNLIGCKFGKYIEASYNTDNYKYNIDDIIENKNLYIKIIERFKEKNKYNYNIKKYKYICLKCGYEGIIDEINLEDKNCLCCINKVAVLGINTIWDTDKWMCEIGVSEEDAKKYTKCSSKKITVKCPNCGRERINSISYINNTKSIHCICEDGFSYPNKFMFNLLEQLGINFIKEYSPKWITPKKYDFYFELNNKKYIIEMDGGFHYQDNNMNGQTIEQTKEIDNYKDSIANQHNIEVIRINCYYKGIKNRKKYIIKSIVNSKLNSILSLNFINWKECENFALSSLVKMTCDLWNSKEFNSTTELGKYKKINSTTVSNYLKIGNDLGLTKYDTNEESKKIIKMNADSNKKQVKVYKNNKYLGTFESSAYISKQSKKIFGEFLYASEIIRVCNKNKNKYKGYYFEYVNNNTRNKKSKIKKGRRIEVFNANNDSLGVFDGCNELSRISEKILGVKLQAGKISLVCNGKRKTHKGLFFKYIIQK